VHPTVPGFNLSVLNNSFVSVSILARRRSTNRAGVENSAIAGGLEQCITHELVHDYVQERIGVFAVQGRAREYYEWNLVVEYLIAERGYSFSEVMADSVTLDASREQMMAWSAGE
jgi:hypothetical protein